MSTTTATATTDSGVAEVAGAALVGQEGVGVASSPPPPPPPPTDSLFTLGEKQEWVLKVVSGDVNITSTSALDKHVTLTSNHWARLMSIREQIDIEAKEINRHMRLLAYSAHIGDRYYVSVTSRYGL